MTRPIYPFDPHGSDVACYIPNEAKSLPAGKLKVIFPVAAPFFLKDFQIKQGTKVLKEGVDFYFGHRYLKGSHLSAQRISGSIWITNKALVGPFQLQYRTVGGMYTVSAEQIAAYLPKMVDPTNEYWDDVLGEDLFYPPVKPAYNRDRFVAEPELIQTLNQVRDAVASKDPTKKESHKLAAALIANLEKIVADSQWAAHKADEQIPHEETHYDAGALHKDGIAKDASKAYGKTKTQLRDAILAETDVSSETAGLFPLNADRVVTGDVVLADGRAHIATQLGASKVPVINLSSGNAQMTAVNDTLVHADIDNVGGKKAKLQSGANVLTVDSSGPGTDNKSVKYNGQEVLTTETLAAYASSASGSAPSSLVYRDGPNIDFSGKGTPADPLKASVTMPDAGAGSPGLATIESVGRNVSGPYGASQKAINDQRKIILSLVPVTRKINGITLDADILLNKGHLGLDKVANLSDLDLPVNNHASELLVDIKAQVGHVHESSEVTVSNATLSQKGVTQHSDAVDSPDITMSTSSVAVNRVLDAAKALEDAAGKYVPEDLMQLSRYGKFSYLPVPVLGSYPAAGPGVNLTHGGFENDGTFVLLRNGQDFLQEAVFYNYGQLVNGKLTKLTATTMQYIPNGAPAGVVPVRVLRGGEGVVPWYGSDGNYYISLTNGTMEASKHKTLLVSNAFGSWLASQDTMLIIADGKLVMINNTWGGQGGCIWHFRVATAPLAVAKDPAVNSIAFTSILISGPNMYGVEQTDVETWQFTSVGIGTEASQPFCVEGGGWSTRNIRHASHDYDIVAEGSKVRVLVMLQTHLAKTGRTWGGETLLSWTFDFLTRRIVTDNPDPQPLRLLDTAMDRATWRVGGNAGGIISGGNASGQNIHSKDYVFTFNAYGREYTPRLYAVKQVNTARSKFEDYDYRVRETVVLSECRVEGNYGSVANNGTRCIHMVEGNRFTSYQNDGARMLAEYDPSSRYLPTVAGFGPTANRKIIPNDEAIRYQRIPYYVEGDVGYSEGCIFTDGYMTGHSKLVGDVFSLPSSISQANWDDLRAKCRAWRDTQGIDPAYYLMDRVMLYVPLRTGLPVMVMYFHLHWDSSSQLFKYRRMALFEAQATRRSGDVGTITLGTLASTTTSGNAVDFQSDYFIRVGTTFAKMDDGRYFCYISGGPQANTLGAGSNTMAFIGCYDPDTKVWHSTEWSTPATHGIEGRSYVPGKGIVEWGRDAAAETVYMGIRGKTLAAYQSGSNVSEVFHMSRVAEGWNVYFTEEVPGILNGNQWKFPKKGFDLKALFPTGYQNATFYIYASIKSGAADYEFSKAIYTDDLERVRIGYCKTDASRITELRVDGFTRLGEFRELADHVASRHVHGIEGKTKEQLGYGLVENKEPRYELKDVGFAEVFNNWHRFSHGANNWAQPSNATELNAWVYDPGTDRIKCTVNSATNIGFVSDVAVGDFVFDVEVGVDATSTDADNDAITLVIAFKSTNGKEQTITVVRSASIEGHVKSPTLFSVAYDYYLPDQKLIASVETNEVKGSPWKGRFSRIVVTRVGDKIDVKATNIEARSWASATEADFIHKMSFTLNDMPELAIFKGENRFGYGAVSQTTATYKTYVRPDADDRNYYATHAAALKALAWHKDVVITNGIAVHGAVLPIPAGFSASEVMYFISPRRRVVGNAAHELSEITRVNLAINQTTRVVTATCTYTFAGVSYTDNMEVNYYAVAIPGGKFFK